MVHMKYDPWSVLDSGSIFNDSLKSLGADWYTLCIVVGSTGMILSGLVIGLRLAYSKTSKSVAIAKDSIITKALIGVLLFAMPFVMGLVVSIAKSF